MSDATAPSPMRSLLLAILMITSTMTVAMNTVNEASAGTSGRTGSNGEFVSVWTNYSTYMDGSDVTGNVQSYNLSTGTGYGLAWELESGQNVVDSGLINWTANMNNSGEYLTWNNLSSGYYCVYVELLSGSTSLHNSSDCFTVTSTPSGYIYAMNANSQYFENSPISMSIYTSHTPGGDYEMAWNLTSGGIDVDSDSDSWTPSGTSTYHSISIGGLSTGYYQMDLYLRTSNGTLVDDSSFSFTVSFASGSIDVSTYPFDDFFAGSTVPIYVNSMNLTSNVSYTVNWSLDDYSNTIDSGSYNWTAYNTSSNDVLSFSNLNNSAVGYYCLIVDLYADNGSSSMWLNSSVDCFTVNTYGDGFISAGTSGVFSNGTLTMRMVANYLTGGAPYTIDWEFKAPNSSVIDSGSSNWTASTSAYHSEYETWNNLGNGEYCLDAELYSNGTYLDSVQRCYTYSGLQDDMGTGGDVSLVYATVFDQTHSGTVGGNDTYDTYVVTLYPGDELEFDANCANQSGCYIMMMSNVASNNQSTYYNLTTNYTDSVFNYNNSNTYTDYVSFTFFGSSSTNATQDYEFFIHVYNPNNGSGGNGSGNGTWSAPTLSIDITELVDHGTATNYSIEFNIDDMDYNSSYSWDFVLLNQTMDLVFSEFVESVSGNTSVTVEAPEVNQGGGIMLDDGCYVMAGFVHDETAQIEVEPIFDYLSVGGDSCTSVFVDVVDWPQQTGDPVMADLLFVDLDLYSNYTVFYQIKNDTSLMSSGNLTTYAESGMYNEMYNISSQGLAEDCYEFHAELYDGNGNLVQNAFEHVDSTYFEVGSPNCAASPGLDVWTDDYIYNAGDGAEVTIEAWDLDQDETYHVYWSLYNGGTYENGSSFSISNADWAENEFTIWDLWTDGCYYLQVELYDDWNNSLDYLGYEFEVGSGNCNTQQNYPSIDVWSQNDGYDWDTGDTVIIGYELMDLNIEHYYSVEWEVHDRENWNMVASGEWSESQAEEHYGNFSIGNLADGCYEIEAQLYDEGSELDIWDWMDDSFTEITVGADTDCNPMSIYAQGGDFESGEDVSFDIYMDNLDNNTNHTIRLELHKQRVGLDSTSEWDFISDGEHMWTEWDLGQLEDGCYGIELYLLSDDGDFARGGHGFRVGDVECVQPWVEMNSDRATFEVEVNYFDMTFYDFPVNQSVDFDYEVWSWDNDYNDNGQFSHNITSWNETYSFNLGMLNDGCYEFNIHYNDEYGGMDYGAQFAVGSLTDEEGNDYRCWDALIHIETVDHRDHYDNGDDVEWYIKVDGMHEGTDYDYMWAMFAENGSRVHTSEISEVLDGQSSYQHSMGLTTNHDDSCLMLEAYLFEDSDGDGMPDNWEDYFGLDSNIDESAYDPDGDGLTNAEEYLMGTNPHDGDSDGDGLGDANDPTPGELEDGMDWHVSQSDWHFAVGDGDCSPPQVEVGAHGSEHWDENDNVWWYLEMGIQAWDLDEGQEYNFQWYIYDEDGMIVDEGEENDMAWNQDLYYYYEINNLSDGCYDVEVYMHDSEWNLLSEDTEEKVEIGMEMNCWAEPGVDFNYNWRGQIEFQVWDLRYNDTYRLSYEIFDNGSFIGGANFNFLSNGGWEDFPVFVTLDAGEYWVEVTLSEAFGGDDIASSNGTIYVGDDSEEIWIDCLFNPNHHFGSGEFIHFDVGMGNLDPETNYELTVQLVRHSDDGREVIEEDVQVPQSNGNYFVSFDDSHDDGYYDIEVQLHDSDSGDWLAGDNQGICVGDGCPTGENVHGDARLELTVYWNDRPVDDDNDDCWRMEVQLIPEQRYLDDQDGNSVYGAYPDWSSNDWGDFTGNEFNFDFDGVPEGDYYVNARVECSGEVDGEWTDYWGEADFDDLQHYYFSSGNSTEVSVDLHTQVRDHDDGGGDGGASEFLEPYMDQSNWIYRATVMEGPNGTELHLSMEISLSPDVIAAVDSMMNDGEGDGVISLDEMDMLMMMLMEEDEHDWDDKDGAEFYWNGVALGADEFQVEGERIYGLVDGENIYFSEFMVFSIDLDFTESGVLGLFNDDDAGDPICDEDMPQDWSVSFFVEGIDGWSILLAEEGFTQEDNGDWSKSFTCADTFPGQMEFTFTFEDDEPEPEPEPEVNSLPQCYIEWYRDGDDLTDSGMSILTAGDSVDDIVVTEGETITIYFNCWDDDGDTLTLVVEPPFGDDATFTIDGNDGSQASSMAKYIQLTVPSGFSGQFEFGAEWSDETAGGDFEFKVIVEPAADDNDEQNDDESASAASFVPGFTGILAMTALLGAVLVFALRREEE